MRDLETQRLATMKILLDGSPEQRNTIARAEIDLETDEDVRAMIKKCRDRVAGSAAFPIPEAELRQIQATPFPSSTMASADLRGRNKGARTVFNQTVGELARKTFGDNRSGLRRGGI